jgi:hypothetical protein
LQAATLVRSSARGNRGRSRRRQLQQRRRRPLRITSLQRRLLTATAAGLRALMLVTTLTATMGSWPQRSRCTLFEVWLDCLPGLPGLISGLKELARRVTRVLSWVDSCLYTKPCSHAGFLCELTPTVGRARRQRRRRLWTQSKDNRNQPKQSHLPKQRRAARAWHMRLCHLGNQCVPASGATSELYRSGTVPMLNFVHPRKACCCLQEARCHQV